MLTFEGLAQFFRVSDACAEVRDPCGLAQTALNSVMARMYWARSKTPGLGQFFWLREPCISRMEGYSWISIQVRRPCSTTRRWSMPRMRSAEQSWTAWAPTLIILMASVA